jgi:hypothetical protein
MLISLTTGKQRRAVFYVGDVSVMMAMYPFTPMRPITVAVHVAMLMSVSMEQHYTDDIEAKPDDADIKHVEWVIDNRMFGGRKANNSFD